MTEQVYFYLTEFFTFPEVLKLALEFKLPYILQNNTKQKLFAVIEHSFFILVSQECQDLFKFKFKFK